MPDTPHKSPRRPSGALRQEHIAQGAFLVEFATPTEPFPSLQPPVLPHVPAPSVFNDKEKAEAREKYRTMERKGFKVTTDTGCLIPHEQYSTAKKGATIKGHQRTFAFFAGWAPSGKGGTVRNQYGWPSNLQISHLCHRRACARPDHLIVEEQWRNIKRNYCGFDGDCDCGSEVQCLRRYQMDEKTVAPVFCKSKAEVLIALEGAPEFVIHGPNKWDQQDTKRAKKNKGKRKRSQEKHAHVTARKQSRLTGGSVSSGSSD